MGGRFSAAEFRVADDPGPSKLRPPDDDVRPSRISEDQLERVAEADAKE
jgi:hypothetical protein